MATINVIRVLTLPVTPLGNSLYYVKNGTNAEAYITNEQGQLFPIVNNTQIGLSIAPTKFSVNTPAATWTILHTFAHLPIVEVFDTAGNKILVDVFIDMTYIVVQFPFPSVGFVLAF